MVVVGIGALALLVVIFLTAWHHFGLSVKLSRLESLLRHGQAAEAVPGLRALEQRHHGKLRVHQVLAQALMAAGEYRQAIREWEMVFLINRRQRELAIAEIAGPLADCQMAVGEWREAQGGLLLALKACPGESLLLERLAMVYLKRGMARHAVSCYESILKLDGEDTTTLIKLATVQEIAGDLRGALATCLHIQRLDAKNGPALLMAARIYGEFKNHSAAEALWRVLAGRNEYRLEALPGLAVCIEAQAGRGEEAAEAWMAALAVAEEKKTRLNILYRMARLLLQAEDIKRAVVLLSEIVSLDPSYRDAAGLLERYAELHEDGSIGRFATGGVEEFRALAGNLLTTLGVAVLREKVVQKRDLVIHGIMDEHGRRATVLVHFSRNLSAIGERDMQEISDELRVIRGKHAWVFSVAGFSADAKAFAKTRQMSLIDREEIRTMLGLGFIPGLAASDKAVAEEKPFNESYERAALGSRIRQRVGVA